MSRLLLIFALVAGTTGAVLAQGAAPAQSPAAAQSTIPRGPAPSLARPASATKATSADGFLQRWLILEPIRTNGQLTDTAVQAAIKAQALPAEPLKVPRHGDKVTVGDAPLAWHAVDTIGYNVNLYHFAYALNKPTSNVLFWVTTIVNAPREMSDVRLAIGSNAASIWWVNGREVIGIFNDRQSVVDDGVSKRLTLQKGPNVIRAAILNGGGATDFCARFLDEAGLPVKGLTVSLVE
jgi:hypothetical protein